MSRKVEPTKHVYTGESQTRAGKVADRQDGRIETAYVDQVIADVQRAVGRPSLTGSSAESPQVSFRLTPELRAMALARAQKEGKSVSTVAREALEKYLHTA